VRLGSYANGATESPTSSRPHLLCPGLQVTTSPRMSHSCPNHELHTGPSQSAIRLTWVQKPQMSPKRADGVHPIAPQLLWPDIRKTKAVSF